MGAALGGVMAGPDITKAIPSALKEVGMAGGPARSYPQAVRDEQDKLAYLQRRKDDLRRWARGEFEEDEIGDHANYDPVSIHYSALKSVKDGPRMIMIARARIERARRWRMESAIMELLGMGEVL
jgi:hypothetical protein